MKQLIELYEDWITGTDGIFYSLSDYEDIPWADDVESEELDIAYIGRSGSKMVSPLVNRLTTGIEQDEDVKEKLAKVIHSLYIKHWIGLYNTLKFEYNPIENYNMEERMVNDETVHEYDSENLRTDNLTHGKSGTDTLTPNTTETLTINNKQHKKTGTETTTHNTTETKAFNNRQHKKTGTEAVDGDVTETTVPNLTETENESIYGFNSTNDSPANKRVTGNTGRTQTDTDTDSTTTYNITDTDTGSESISKTGTDELSYNLTETDTGGENKTRTGTETTLYNTTETDTGTERNQRTGADTDTRNYLLTRKGNIGVTTSQQMIEQERALWMWNFFNDVVFPDIDKILTIMVY